jgi:glucoamylase
MSIGTGGADPSVVAPYMFALMQRNLSTSGFVSADHNAPGSYSAPGCVLASPSWPGYAGNVAAVSYDYVFNWTRDAAITLSVVLSQAPAQLPTQAAADVLARYVDFASTCQASGNLGQAKYTPQGGATGAADESDGPALRVITILQGFADLDPAAQAVARNVIAADLNYILDNDRYQQPTVTLWEDTYGQSIFARAVQLRCLNRALAAEQKFNLDIPGNATAAVTWLGQQIPTHWSAPDQRYISVLGPQRLAGDPAAGYDPAIDPILACLYGDGIPATDPGLLSTAAQVRAQWAAGGSDEYPINAADAARGIGPLIGRYLGDEYDGVTLTSDTGHPWAVCSSGFAQLYYEVAAAVQNGAPVPDDPLAATFLEQVGVGAGDPPAQVSSALRAAGDSMLNAVVYHSNSLELSEQFDQGSGYERSVTNLTWSYAAFLLATGTR